MELNTVHASDLSMSSLKRSGEPSDVLLARTAAEPLPESHQPFTDKYFLRSGDILRANDLNPWARAQVAIRSGPGIVGGVEEALEIVQRYSSFFDKGGIAYGLPRGASYSAGEAVLVFEGPLQELIELETMYLGVISAETTLLTDGISRVDPAAVTARMKKVVEALGEDRAATPVIYMGARHWRWSEDRAIGAAALAGGATQTSTDVASAVIGQRGIGTIPHVLENVCAYYFGRREAVAMASQLFADRYGDSAPVYALIDYDNREIDDSLAVAAKLGSKLVGVRVDTCGENVAQGALYGPNDPGAQPWLAEGIKLPDLDHPDARYWYGRGVTVTGVYALRRALDEAGLANVTIVLSSGFADANKVRAFADAEKILGVKLFDALGVGGLYDSRSAKMDIVALGDTAQTMIPISKAGRRQLDLSRLVALSPSGKMSEDSEGAR